MRQDVLESQGWTIIRLWSTDWFRSPLKARENLLREVRAALSDAVGSASARPQEKALPERSAAVSSVDVAPPEPTAPAVVVPQLAEAPKPGRPPVAVALPPQETLVELPPPAPTAPADVASEFVAAPPPAPIPPAAPQGIVLIAARSKELVRSAISRVLEPKAHRCPRCQAERQVMLRDTPYLQCPNRECAGKEELASSILTAALRAIGATCDCGHQLKVARSSRNATFIGCSDYPNHRKSISWKELE